MTKLKLSALALCGALFFGCFGGEDEQVAPTITQGMEVQDIVEALAEKAQNLAQGILNDAAKAAVPSFGASTPSVNVDELKALAEQVKNCATGDNGVCNTIAKTYQKRYQSGEEAELNYENAMTLYQLSCIRKDSSACKDGVKLLTGLDKMEIKVNQIKSQFNTGSLKKELSNKAFLVVIDTVCEKIDAAIVGGNEICKPVGEVLAEVAAEKI